MEKKTTIFRVFIHISGGALDRHASSQTWACGDFATEDEAWKWIEKEDDEQPEIDYWIEKVEV